MVLIKKEIHVFWYNSLMKNFSIHLALGGSLFTLVLGAALHFVFEWSNNSLIVAPIAAVNESTWEHIKIGFWPLLIWMLVKYYFFKVRNENFVIAEAVTIAAYGISIPILFYVYTAILGENYLFLDIAIFVISILIGQYAGYRILYIEKRLNLKKIGAFIILALLFSFVYFTFFPPENFLFQDPVSKDYGVISH